MGATWQNLGNIALERGDWNKADELYRKSLAIRRSLNDDCGTAMVLSNLALAALRRTAADQADAYIAEASPLFARLGDVRNQARLIDIQGELAQARGQLLDAIRLHFQARQMRESIGDRMGIGLSLHNLPWAHFRAGDRAAAAKHLQDTLDIWREIGADGQIPFTLELAAELADAWQRSEEAASLMVASLNLSHDESRIESDPRLKQIGERLSVELFQKAVEAGRTWSVEAACEVARQFLLELAPEV